MNAIIMAAGMSSRFAPLSYEKPKGLLKIKGEILIERQIRQLREAGISDIIVVVGYMAEQFLYLKEKFNVKLVLNEDYYRYNNTSSVIKVVDQLCDTYLCSSDNYYPHNLFLGRPEDSFYSALYADGATEEYCLTTNEQDYIVDVKVGGGEFLVYGRTCFFHQILLGEVSRDIEGRIQSRRNTPRILGGFVCAFHQRVATNENQKVSTS